MRRATLACAAVACIAGLALPATGGAVPGERGKSAIAKACAAEKKADKAAFRAKYGKHAMRNCIKGEVATVEPVVTVVPTNPAQTCAELQAADAAGFTAQWGGNGNGKNAYGKCVSSTAQSSHDQGPPPWAHGSGPPA